MFTVLSKYNYRKYKLSLILSLHLYSVFEDKLIFEEATILTSSGYFCYYVYLPFMAED